MTKRATIRDVAKYAGVSSATVSYVLNDVKKVSEKTKVRVYEAIEQLNYYPDYNAVGLSKRKSSLIGILVPLAEDSPASVFKKNLYYNEFISGVEVIVRNSNFDTMITGVANPEECRRWVKKRNLDGLIFLGEFPENLYNEIKKLDIPIVLIDTYGKFTNVHNNVRVNDELGGYLATKHLIDLGHKDIAFIATNLSRSPVDTKRYQGYKRALQEQKIVNNPQLLFEVNEVKFEQRYIVDEILQLKQRLTGIVTVSDVLAIGIMKALHDRQKLVPEDYSIVGFDDLSISQYTSPGLTTIRQDIFEKGKSAAELLVRSIDLANSEHQTMELPVELIIRQSTRTI